MCTCNRKGVEGSHWWFDTHSSLVPMNEAPTITRFFPVASSKILLESSGVWSVHMFCRSAPGTLRKPELKERGSRCVSLHKLNRKNEKGAQTHGCVIPFCPSISFPTSTSTSQNPVCGKHLVHSPAACCNEQLVVLLRGPIHEVNLLLLEIH